MTAHLSFPYNTGLTKNEQIKIDERTKQSRKEFSKGFVQGSSIAIGVSFFYSLAFGTFAAHATDGGAPAPAGDTCPGAPAPPAPPGAVAPVSKPGFKPLSDGVKGTFVGGAGAICTGALQSGDFLLGLACAFLLVLGGILMNRPNQP